MSERLCEVQLGIHAEAGVEVGDRAVRGAETGVTADGEDELANQLVQSRRGGHVAARHDVIEPAGVETVGGKTGVVGEMGVSVRNRGG